MHPARLLQREIAERLGVDRTTVYNWESGSISPAQWQWPAIVAFLGYVPFSTDGDLPNRLKAYRRVHGLSQIRLAALIGVDPSSVAQGAPERCEKAAREALHRSLCG